VGLDTTIDLGWNGWCLTRLAIENRFFAFEHVSFAETINGIHMHAKSFGNLVTRELTADAVGITEEKNTCVTNLAHGC
jgi:hypothetical protein